MNVLIVYGTSEGQTRKIAEWAARHVRRHGHDAELRDSADVASGLNLERFDAFVVAASVHHEYHQATVRDFVVAHRRALDAKPSAFISVSLSAVLEGAHPEAKNMRRLSTPLVRNHALGGSLFARKLPCFGSQGIPFVTN